MKTLSEKEMQPLMKKTVRELWDMGYTIKLIPLTIYSKMARRADESEGINKKGRKRYNSKCK